MVASIEKKIKSMTQEDLEAKTIQMLREAAAALQNLQDENARLRKACDGALEHVQELREAWRSGAINESDGGGGTRSNRNVDVEVTLRDALKESDDG